MVTTPMMHVMQDIGGVEVPSYLGKVTGDAKPSTSAASTDEPLDGGSRLKSGEVANWAGPRMKGVRHRLSWYNQAMEIPRITHDPAVMGGKPCIRGLRVTVGTIIGLLASGQSPAGESFRLILT